jgi:Family of unknown function (DUF6502)
MADLPDTNHVLTSAVLRLLRPLARVLLRHGIPFSAFEALGKQAYIDVAMSDFALPGKKPTISRVSILTGLTRKDVQRWVHGEPGEAAKVLAAWLRDPRFHDAHGEPRPLAIDGDPSFSMLVRLHSGDMPARAVLDELLHVGAVADLGEGRYQPAARAYVPQRSEADKLVILGHDAADLIETIDHNLQHGTDDPRFQRKVMYDSVPLEALPEFRRLSAQQGQALLESLDRWLAAHDAEVPPGAPPAPRARVGLGVYYFEERRIAGAVSDEDEKR